MSTADQSLWQQEQGIIQKFRTEHPELFQPVKKEPGTLMRRVGILVKEGEHPSGYIKYSPLDFIVEEIRPSEEVVTVDGPPATAEYESGEGTVYGDLIKIGVSTLDAAGRIADALRIDRKQIGYAGIKDAVALTSQRISLRGVALEAAQQIQAPNCVLKNVLERKGVIGVGNLSGNRFTLTIRTEHPIDAEKFSAQIDEIKASGLKNYYGVQRFGTPRFLAHLFGMHLLRGEFETCVKVYLTKESEFELPFFSLRRKQAAEHFGNWQKMKEIFSELPYTYRFELAILDALIKSPTDYLEAVHAVPEQASMWIRAYSSYLINLLLAEADQSGKTLPDEIPLMLGKEGDSDSWVMPWMKKHGTDGYRKYLRSFRFVQAGKNPTVEPIVRPTFHEYKVIPAGVVLSFDLQKGAYATTVLEALFNIVTGYPVAEWVNRDEIDAKRELGTGDLGEVRELFAGAIKDVMSRKKGDEEASS